MTSMKIIQFSRSLTPCPSTSKIFPPLSPWTSNFKRTPTMPMITNKLKENRLQGWLLHVGPSLRSAFVFIINSLILSHFPLTFFRLAEASLPAFLWLYTLVCALAPKYHEMSLIDNYSHFWVLTLQSTCFIFTTWKRK